MSGSSRTRWSAVAKVAIAVIFVASLTGYQVAAFDPGPHRQILEQSIGTHIDQSAFADILGALRTGQGNLGSDLHQFDNYRHFDNAPDPRTVCSRATAAWTHFYAEIRDSLQPQNAPEYDKISGMSQARSALGALTHALHDFYAHTNWIELHVAAKQSPPLALPLFQNCVSSSLPVELQTGFFDLSNGLDGCPHNEFTYEFMPPPGFTYCHVQINKDSDQTRQGRKVIPGTTTTYFALAAQLATDHTKVLYDTVVKSLTGDWKTKFPQLRTDCLIERVMVVDVSQPCRLARLKFVDDSYDRGTRLSDGTVTISDARGATVVSTSISKSSWPYPVISVPQCLYGLTVEWQFYIDDNLITPVSRKVSGKSQLNSAGCDAEVHIVPESLLTYLIRFKDADTVIASFTDVTIAVNGGQWLVHTGPVVAGSTKWIDLGTCSNVVNFDFITYQFIDPIDNTTPRTATLDDPDSPPNPANPGCLDSFTANIGPQIYH